MKVYIQPHLRKIEIVDQMYNMIQEYANYYVESVNSFSDYYYFDLKNDPVKKFLKLCISEDSIKEGQEYEEVINYLSRLFYSVKGTVKVFDYMKQYLGLEFEGDIVYTTKYIEFKLAEISISDENLFYESMRDFLDALLYFRELRSSIDSVDLVLSGEISSSIGSGIVVYNKFIATPYED